MELILASKSVAAPSKEAVDEIKSYGYTVKQVEEIIQKMKPFGAFTVDDFAMWNFGAGNGSEVPVDKAIVKLLDKVVKDPEFLKHVKKGEKVTGKRLRDDLESMARLANVLDMVPGSKAPKGGGGKLWGMSGGMFDDLGQLIWKAANAK